MKERIITSEQLRAHRAVLREFARALSRRLTSECRLGCSWCCTHDQPPVARFEVEVLMELVRRRADLADVPDKIAAQVRVLDGLAASDPLPGITDHRGLFPCVFLGQGKCRVYEHRPIACVVTYSRDRGECERSVREGDFSKGAGWDLAARLPGEAILESMKHLSSRTAEFVRATVEDASSFRKETGHAPLLLIALATLWSDETKAAIEAAAEKRRAREAKGASAR